MADESHEATYGLVMPFVVCESKGGPYQDNAFVAGVRYGQIDREARTIGTGCEKSWTVETPLVPQLDLLAMHLGVTFTVEPWDEHPDEWRFVTFSRHSDGSAEGGATDG